MNKTTNIIVAAAAGFVAGILLAPKKGEDTRADIKNKALEAKEFATEKAQKAKIVAADATHAVKKSVEKASVEADAMNTSVRGAAGRVGESVEREVTSLSEEAKARGSRVANDAKHTVSQVRKDAEKHLR